jgi:7-cyano-7-deazaguanine synthase
MSDPKAVAIVSGGMDSAVLAYWAKNEGFDLSLLSFDYGQRHKRELIFASLLAMRLHVPHSVVDLSSITKLLSPSGSSLVSSKPVPEGHYSAESMAQTVVPNRNAIMLSIAYGHAVAIGAKNVFFGAHWGDAAQYPDCRADFVEDLNRALYKGNQGFADVELELEAPFVKWSKTDIAKEGKKLGVPFELTWSCYKGDELHCGRCGTCVERLEALHAADVEDKTEYADAEYWKQAVAEFAAKKG